MSLSLIAPTRAGLDLPVEVPRCTRRCMARYGWSSSSPPPSRRTAARLAGARSACAPCAASLCDVCRFQTISLTKFFGAEDRVQQQLQIVTRGRVAVQVERAGRLEDPAQFDQPRRHHRRGRRACRSAPRSVRNACMRLRDLAAGLDDLLVGGGRLRGPSPRVLEGLDLRGGPLAVLLREQDVVVGVRVERRVQVDEVNRLVLDVSAQDVEVVAVVEDVLPLTGRG